MNGNDRFFPHAAAAICGFVVYVAITSATGKNEAWDDGSYYTIGIPLMCAVAFAIAMIFMAIISTPQLLAAFIGSKLSPKKAAQ